MAEEPVAAPKDEATPLASAGPRCDDRQSAGAVSKANILGLTSGMSIEEAKHVLLCANAEFVVAEMPLQRSSQSMAEAKLVRRLVAKFRRPRNGDGALPASDELTLLFADDRAATKLIKIDRLTRYSDETGPLASSFREELARKYPGIDIKDVGSRMFVGRLARTADDQVLSSENRQFSTCIATGAWHLAFRLQPNCGLSVGFQVNHTGGELDRVDVAQSSLLDHAFAAVTLQNALASTAPALEAERQKAIDAAPKPQL